ncbi:hypothetical protein NL676_018374 [Syzygium grande]|nr:hypothetical protein NL676_018374 [Syzygium grande]
MAMKLNFPFLLIFIFFSSAPAKPTYGFTNETDYQALLAMKDQITDDPLHALTSWNNSIPFCDWPGVTCSQKHERVIALNLSSLQLKGSLSSQVGNLSFLRTLRLDGNGFHGTLTEDIGRLFRLQTLSLVNNSFEGELPKNLSRCVDLSTINLWGNNFSGTIPDTLSHLPKLTHIGLSTNQLTRKIPPSLGNLSSLRRLYAARNLLEGSIPQELGQLSILTFLQLSVNKLSGPIPTSLYNISSMILFSVALNNLSGVLPSDLFLTLPKLQGFYVGGNQFSGPIPNSISNATELVQINGVLNSFSGSIPPKLGGLQNLQLLSFGGNFLGTEKGDDLRFLRSLSNCTSLMFVRLPLNHLKGMLPDSLANFSTTFTSLRLDQNLVHGSIPFGVGNLVNLELLSLSENELTGNIPLSIGALYNLQVLWLSHNNISGIIPFTLGNASSLNRLILRDNMLEGSIPASIGNCNHLNELDLSRNNLTGSVPGQVFGLPSLSIGLSLAGNALTGPMPLQVGEMVNLMALDVSENSMSGAIPITLGNCLVLEFLILKGNQFSGAIPSSFKNLKGIQVVDLSGNNLSGPIPEFFAELRLIRNLNLSLNMLAGEVPKGGIFRNLSAISVEGNNKLCGGIQELQLPPCDIENQKNLRKYSNLKKVLAISITFSIFIGLACTSIVLLRAQKSRKETTSSANLKNQYVKLSYSELFKATDGFSLANLIGQGSFGAVFKGKLTNNQTVAVKVIKLQERIAKKSLLAEYEASRSVRHRNLVKIITSCSSIDFQGNDFEALVFEFMPNGSLDKWLHPTGDWIKLNMVQRLDIAIDVAAALDYLHHQCHAPIAHCDLKPSNVLLDDDLRAHVSDFGLAKFLLSRASQMQTSSIGIRGTVGYVAPEYGLSEAVSTQGDVYSYGILLLELFTGKRPTESMFVDNFNLHEFVKMALPDRFMQVIDPSLNLEEERELDDNGRQTDKTNSISTCLATILRIGVICSAASPGERMDIGDVVTELHKAKTFLLGREVVPCNKVRNRESIVV